MRYTKPGNGIALFPGSCFALVHWRERIVEHVVPDPATLGDTLRLVEDPVDAEVDSAYAVFFFSLGE